MAALILTFAATGLVLVALAIPLIQRRVRPNGWYGLRVQATFADESVWYAANARSGRDLLILGVLQVAVALLVPLWRVSDVTYVAINTAVLLGGALFVAFVGIRRANRMRGV